MRNRERILTALAQTFGEREIDAEPANRSSGSHRRSRTTAPRTKWLRFDTFGGLIFMQNLNVTDNQIRQPQAIRPPNNEFVSVLGNGKYEQFAFFLGGGFRAFTDMKTAYKR